MFALHVGRGCISHAAKYKTSLDKEETDEQACVFIDS